MKPNGGFLVCLTHGGVVKNVGICTCEGCNLRMGAAEKPVVFRGGDWHKHCLVAAANVQLRELDPAIRIRNWRLLSNRVILALRELAAMSQRRQKDLSDLIKFCVDFLREAVENPSAIPAVFQLEAVTA